jgi:hypothetical protein
MRLESTLKWRRDYGIYDILTSNLVEPEVRFTNIIPPRDFISLTNLSKAVTGKMFPYGFDTHRRPALYMIPSRQNTDEPTRQIQFTVWTLERCVDLMGPGIECVRRYPPFIYDVSITLTGR